MDGHGAQEGSGNPTGGNINGAQGGSEDSPVENTNGVQGGNCIVDYEIAFDSQAEAAAASKKMKDKNEHFTDPDVFKSVFKAELKELGLSNAMVEAVKGAETHKKAEFFTRSPSKEDDAADATAATADAVPLFSGGTFVGGIALGIGLCAIIGGIVWMKRSRGGIKFKSPKFQAKPSMNSYGLHGGEMELTEITISNKKTTNPAFGHSNPAFGHSKKLAGAAKKKKRKSQKAKAHKPGTTNTTSPSEPKASTIPDHAAKTQGAGERKRKEKAAVREPELAAVPEPEPHPEPDTQIHSDPVTGRKYSWNSRTSETKWLP
jgi:hypothetical protein